MPFTFDAFDIVKVSLERVLGLVALGAWAWDMLRRGGTLRRTPVDWLILAFLAWVALTTVTSIHWPTALFGKPRRYEGLLSFVNYAVIYFLVLQFADSAARVRRLAQALFCVEPDRRRLRCCCSSSAWSSSAGAALPVRGQPRLLHLRQPRSARRLPDLLGHGRPRARAPRAATCVAPGLLGGLRPQRAGADRRLHARRLDRRRRQPRAAGRHRLAAARHHAPHRLGARRGLRRRWASPSSGAASPTPTRS